MKKIVMVKERVFFKSPILKCSKLQGSNVFSIKLSSFFFFKILKICTFSKKSSKMIFFFPFGHNMEKKITIVKIGFCKTIR